MFSLPKLTVHMKTISRQVRNKSSAASWKSTYQTNIFPWDIWTHLEEIAPAQFRKDSINYFCALLRYATVQQLSAAFEWKKGLTFYTRRNINAIIFEHFGLFRADFMLSPNKFINKIRNCQMNRKQILCSFSKLGFIFKSKGNRWRN